MVSISLCMIVKNEEEFLEQCLNSVKDLVDEIIIIDTGSNDKTKNIAKKFTNQIFDFEWCDDFSVARNESLKHATGDWILILDADEEISKKDHNKIREVIKSNNKIAFYLVHRHYTNNSQAGGWISLKDDNYDKSKVSSGYYPNWIVRLFKNDNRIFFEGCVHENVNNSVKKIGEITTLNIPIHHYGMLDLQKLLDKGKFYEKLGKKKLSEDNHFTYYELGVQFSANNNTNKAIECFEKSVNIKPDHAPSWAMLGAVYKRVGKIDSAIQALERAKKHNPKIFSVYVNLASIQNELGDFNEALGNLQLALRINNKNPFLFVNLGYCLYKLGKEKKSALAFRRAAELDQKYKDILKLK